MSLARPGRVQHRWHCWRGDEDELERVLSTFEAAAVTPAMPLAGAAAASPAPASSREHHEQRVRQGDWRAVVMQTDLGRLAELSIGVPPAMHGTPGDVWLECSRGHGMVLKAVPGSFDAVTRTKAALMPVVEPGVPRGSWLLSGAVEASFAVVLGAVLDVLWLWATGNLDDVEPGLGVASLAVGIAIAYGLLRLVRLAIPRLRITAAAPERHAPG